MGEWRPKDIYANKTIVLERQATGKVKKNGRYEVAFLHTGGKDPLEVQGITVYKNGSIIADDMHKASIGEKTEDNVYVFEIDDYETGAAYQIRANIKGIEGVDSNGVIFIKLKEN